MSLNNLPTLLLLMALCHVAVNFTLLGRVDGSGDPNKQGLSVRGTETIRDDEGNLRDLNTKVTGSRDHVKKTNSLRKIP